MKVDRTNNALAGFAGAVLATVVQLVVAYALFAMQGSATLA